MKFDRLNLGSGSHPFDGFTNVDLYSESADIREDVMLLQVNAGSVREIVCFHFIEHIDRADAVLLIGKVYSWLAKGGTFAVETPDREKCLELIRKRTTKIDRNGITSMFGAVGIIGGRPFSDPYCRSYHEWAIENCDLIAEQTKEHHYMPIEMIPDWCRPPGTHHRYVWSEQEMREAMQSVGFAVRSEHPTTHGKREYRDLRLVGVKR